MYCKLTITDDSWYCETRTIVSTYCLIISHIIEVVHNGHLFVYGMFCRVCILSSHANIEQVCLYGSFEVGNIRGFDG